MTGLSTDEAARRLAANGRNELAQAEAKSPVWLLLGQFNSPVIWLLLGACAVSAVLREVADAVAIGTIVVINGVVGFLQEYRAERSLKALQSMTAPRARVLRGGALQVVPAAEVVVGDVLALEAGDLVAADAHLLEAHALKVAEAALTGESEAVDKSTDPVPEGAPLAERHDQVFMGTAVATGVAQAEVTGTGMQTELGRIAHLLANTQSQATPLQARLASLGRVLLLLCLGIVAVVVALGLWHGLPLLEVLLSGVSLAVAAVPEGLPAVVTIALALGVQRMVQRNVLVRRLHSVETLGSATVVCTDKTGTLTTGQMAVRELWGPDHQVLLDAAAACCDAELGPDGRTGVGDPTEVAILAAAAQHGIARAALEAERPRVEVTPFDSVRKCMSVWRADQVLYVKGAPEVIVALGTSGTDKVLAAAEQFAARGLRVLAVARGRTRDEKDLEVLGLVAMADPPRSEAIAAVAAARQAGITTVMITGDSLKTATAIAREMGILQLRDDPATVVHARASPEDKLRIVKEWKSQGAIVAMTGDGVNDAPALREAHIGIAMGRGGTEVTREASDMVLTDDNFASIIAAVAEGRAIFANIRKTVLYLLIGNFGELLVMLATSVMGVPLPLLPLHLLWVNLVTDGLPALALVVDPPDGDVMKARPRPPDEPLIGRREWVAITLTGLVEAGTVLAVYLLALPAVPLDKARTLAFTTLVFAELFRAFAARSPTRLFWETGVFSNLKLLGVIVLSMAVQLGLCFVPATEALFGVTTLTPLELLHTVGASLIPTTLLELSKLVRRLWSGGRAA